jgi:hypothetical protein
VVDEQLGEPGRLRFCVVLSVVDGDGQGRCGFGCPPAERGRPDGNRDSTGVPAAPSGSGGAGQCLGAAGPGNALQPVPDLTRLDALIEQVRSAGLATTLEIHGAAAGDVPAGLQLTVYRVVQEALTNTLKHGGVGARALVRLHFLPGELRVDIDDDGAGNTVPAPASTGSGLVGMRERVRAYGGDVQAGPRQPEGR